MRALSGDFQGPEKIRSRFDLAPSTDRAYRGSKDSLYSLLHLYVCTVIIIFYHIQLFIARVVCDVQSLRRLIFDLQLNAHADRICVRSFGGFPLCSKGIERNEDPLVGTFSMVQFPPTVMVAYAANCEPRTAALSPRYCQTGGVWDPLDPLYKRPPHGGIVTTEPFLTVWDWTIMTSLGTGVLLPCLLLSEPSIFIYTRISIVMLCTVYARAPQAQ